MSESKHTPGPWVAFMGNSVQTEQGRFICTTVSFGRSAPEESPANARLIAAAPDLLAALKTLVGHEEPGAMFSERIQAALAAIAKAEGSDA